MLNLSLDEVKAYAADYTAVPVAKECFADMVTPLGFWQRLKTAAAIIFCWKAWKMTRTGAAILL